MSRVSVPVYRRDLVGSETELARRLQALAELELDRLRARYRDHDLATITSVLTDGLVRVTAGVVDDQHAAQAAAALQRGEDLAVELVTASPAVPAPGSTGESDPQP